MNPESNSEGKKKNQPDPHGLELVLRHSGKGDAHGQGGDDEYQGGCEQQQEAACHRHVKKKIAGGQDKQHLDVAH